MLSNFSLVLASWTLTCSGFVVMTAPIHGQQGEEYALLTAMIKSRAEEHLTYQVPNTPKPAPLLQLCNQTQTSLLSEETTWTSYMHQVMPRLTSLNASELQLVGVELTARQCQLLVSVRTYSYVSHVIQDPSLLSLLRVLRVLVTAALWRV